MTMNCSMSIQFFPTRASTTGISGRASSFHGVPPAAVLLGMRSKRPQRAAAFSIRCEQASNPNESGGSNSFDIWLGRAAMLGFVSVLGVEIGSGKGLLETAGVSTPAPTLALVLTGLVGTVTAFRIFTSVSRN